MERNWWQAPCGCYKSGPKPSWRPWVYSPGWFWHGWSTLLPFGRGGDEWCRWTLILGWTATGRIIVPLWYCRGNCETCGPTNWDYLPEIDFEEEANRKLDYYED